MSRMLRTQLLATILFGIAWMVFPQHADAASFAPRDEGMEFSDGVVGDGVTPFAIVVSDLEAGLATLSAGACGEVYAATSPNTAITTITVPNERRVTLLVRANPVRFFDPSTGANLAAPACAGQDLVLTIQQSTTASVPIPIVYPTSPPTDFALQTVVQGDLPPTTYTSGTTITLDGDGQSTAKLKTTDILVNATIPWSVPSDTIVHAKLLIPGGGAPILGTLATANGTPTETFLVRNGVAAISIIAPVVAERSSVTNTLLVWTDIGDVKDFYTVQYLAPGYVADTILTLPFEDTYGSFSLKSRLNDPLLASNVTASASTDGVKDFGLQRGLSDLLLYDSANGIAGIEGTLSMWMKPASAARGSTMTLFADTQANGTPLPGSPTISVTLSPTNRVTFRFQSASVSADLNDLGTTAYRHIAASWNDEEIHLYLDGVIAASAPRMGAPTPPVPIFGAALAIGSNGTADRFVGSMDSVYVYTRALTDEEVVLVSQNSAAGMVNSDMQMHSVASFTNRVILGTHLDMLEETDDRCWDSDEQGGTLNSRCIGSLHSRPIGAAKVVSCVENDVVVPCNPLQAQEHIPDAIYAAVVGAQQFGGSSIISLGNRETTDLAIVPGPGFPSGPSVMSPRFAGPVSTRFRLPPKQVPNLVICNFPVVAGQPLNLSDLHGYIFEDREERHYQVYDPENPLFGRFQCASSMDELRMLRANYEFTLRDNTGEPLERGWRFKFKLNDTFQGGQSLDHAFAITTHGTLNDSSRLTPDNNDGSPYFVDEVDGAVYQAVTTMIDNDTCTPDACEPQPITDASVYYVSSADPNDPDDIGGLFDITLPGTYTRLAAQTVLLDGSTTERPLYELGGFVRMENIEIMFDASGGSGADSWFESEPFSIQYEVVPAAPTTDTDVIRKDWSTSTGQCDPENLDATPLDPTCDRATEVRIERQDTQLTVPAESKPAAALFADGLAGTVTMSVKPIRSVSVQIEEFSGVGGTPLKRWFLWSNDDFGAPAAIDATPPEAARRYVVPEDGVWTIDAEDLPELTEYQAGFIYRITLNAIDEDNNSQPLPTIVTFIAE